METDDFSSSLPGTCPRFHQNLIQIGQVPACLVRLTFYRSLGIRGEKVPKSRSNGHF